MQTAYLKTKLFTSKEECDEYLMENFGKNHKPVDIRMRQEFRNYYINTTEDGKYIVVIHYIEDEADILRDKILNLEPNTTRGDKRVYEATVTDMARDLGLGRERTELRHTLEEMRINSTGAKHSIKDNLYPKSIYAVGAYWRISPLTTEKKKLKFGK